MGLTNLEKAADKRALETIHPALYGTIILAITHKIKLSEQVLRNVTLASRFILLLDSFYETGELKYNQAADKTCKQLGARLLPQQRIEFQKVYDELSSFWEYERSLTNQKKFNQKKRARYLSRKSSDVFLYSLIAGFASPLPNRIIRALHARQQLSDIYDDCIDMDEDRENNSPNLIFLFSWSYTSPKDLHAKEREEILDFATQLLANVAKNAKDAPFIYDEAEGLYRKIFSLLKN